MIQPVVKQIVLVSRPNGWPNATFSANDGNTTYLGPLDACVPSYPENPVDCNTTFLQPPDHVRPEL